MLNHGMLCVNIFLDLKKHRENGRQTVTLGVFRHMTECHGENHNIQIEPLHSLEKEIMDDSSTQFICAPCSKNP